MTVTVLIERHVTPGKEHELNALLRELLAAAMMHPGYIFGETLTAVEDPSTHLVISNWVTLEEWQAWEITPERQRFLNRISALLRAPPRTTLWQDRRPAEATPGV